MQRRSFLASAMATGAAARRTRAAQPLPKREYRDGVKLSIVAFGGIVVNGMEQPAANRIVAEAFDRGVNYFDVAPSYGNGEAEEKLGPALEPFRQRVFLSCKTQKRDAAGAREELERSLRRLRTDHVDLYQFHAVSSMRDVEQILGPNGAAETFEKARKEGKARFLGFSAHSAEAAIALMDRFRADSVLFPVNFVLFAQGNFGPQIIAKAKEKGVARMALKGLAYSPWPANQPRAERAYSKCWYKPVDDPDLARRALRFTLSQEITAAVPPGDERLWRLAMDIGASFKPMPPAEQRQLLASTQGVEPLFRAG
jgi:aryl-alcohol dehydrogenase-like predicted oxidoreductase